MISRASDRFWKAYHKLPGPIQQRVRASFEQFKVDPYHRSLAFKRIRGTRDSYSARIGLEYRAVGSLRQGVIVWHWIGPHAEYDRLVARPGGMD